MPLLTAKRACRHRCRPAKKGGKILFKVISFAIVFEGDSTMRLNFKKTLYVFFVHRAISPEGPSLLTTQNYCWDVNQGAYRGSKLRRWRGGGQKSSDIFNLKMYYIYREKNTYFQQT
jgi:hypothetical protein